MGARLGQHFLARTSVLRRIAEAACPETVPQVIEIGPGRGALTEHLLARAERVIAIEIDVGLGAHLRERFRGETRLEVVEGDVLQQDLSRWGPAVIVGNLPYYITAPILQVVLRLGGLVRRAVFLVQKEVAERIAAQPGSRDYGYLSVLARATGEPEYLFTVPASAFQPPPKVDSAVVRVTLRPPEPDLEEWLRFVGLCFHQKRKTLRNNLAPSYGRQAVDALPEAGLRAEQISVERFRSLYRALAACSDGRASPPEPNRRRRPTPWNQARESRWPRQ